MTSDEHILISLEPRHANNILSGLKRVELRRRPMRLEKGATVWIYSKLPVGSVVGKARVISVRSGSPQSLWRRFGADSGIGREEFFDYFTDTTSGVALILDSPKRLRKSLSLELLRKLLGHFHPPQFFMRLGLNHPVLQRGNAIG